MQLEVSGRLQVGEYVEGTVIQKEKTKRKEKQNFYTFLFGKNLVQAYSDKNLDLKVGEKYLFKVLGMSRGQFLLRLYSFHASLLDALPRLRDFEGDILLGWILDEYLENNLALEQDEVLCLFFFLKDKEIKEEKKRQWLKKVLLLRKKSEFRMTKTHLTQLFSKD